MCGQKCASADAFKATILFYVWLVMWEAVEFQAGRISRLCCDFSEQLERDVAAAGIRVTLVRTPGASPAAASPFTSRPKRLRLGTKWPLRELLRDSYVISGGD